jgi:hypothetical protein
MPSYFAQSNIFFAFASSSFGAKILMMLLCIHYKQTLSPSLDNFCHPELSGGDMK